MSGPALAVTDLEVRYGPVAAVRGVSFEVGPGEIVGLIGPNGAGKSSTLHAIMGLVRIGGGDVRLGERSLRGKPPEAVARILTPERRQRARALGAAVRLGADLSGRNPALLAHSRLRIADGRLLLSAERGSRDLLLGEQTTKRAATLAQCLRLKLEVA